MKILSRYIEKILRYKIFILILIVGLSLFFGPIGFNAFNVVESELGFSQTGSSEGVFTFTSLKDDVVIVFDGNEDIISESFSNYIAQFVFDLQNNRIIQDLAEDAARFEHIFSATQQLLSQYYTSVYTAMGIANVSLYIVLEGSDRFLQIWTNESITLNEVEISELLIPQIQEEISEFAFGDLGIMQNFVSSWINQTGTQLIKENPAEFTKSDLINLWKINTSLWSSSLPQQFAAGIESFITNLDVQSSWTPELISKLVAIYLFGSDDIEYTDFLLHVFDNGSSGTRPIELAREILIPFIKLQYIPPGFPVQIRDYYLNAFTNFDGENPPTSMIIRFRLRSGLSQSELNTIFAEIESIVHKARDDLSPETKVGFLSFLNFQKERNDIIAEEMHLVDLIAIVIGFLILLIILRDPILSGIVVTIAWGSAQVSRGILVTLLPIIGEVNSTSFSVTTTLLLGAAMNYVVFFQFRYLEERKNDKDHEEAVIVASNTALHSILISGTALILSMIPYFTSSQQILSELATGVVFGMLIQILFMFHALPVIYLSLKRLEKAFHNTQFERIPTFAFGLNKSKSRKVIVISLVFAIISLIVIFSLNSSFIANDVLGESGETGSAVKIIEDSYPDEYLSRYLISIDFSSPIFVNVGDLNLTKVDIIDSFSHILAGIESMGGIISIAWPLGTSYNFTDPSLGQIQDETANIVVDELTNGNSTFIIMQSMISSESPKLIDQATTVLEKIEDFKITHPGIKSIKASGLPLEIQSLSEDIENELPIQIFIAMVLITIFLALVLKSIWVPFRLELTIVLGSIYSIAAGSLIFKLFTGVPLNLIVISSSFLILLGLGTDFDIYLYRRIQEEHRKGKSFKHAVSSGIDNSAPAIISSGLVMAFSFLALLNSDINLVRQFGLVIFITIIVDILIVRTIIVPAILLFTDKEERESDQ